jgi:hypothetical protein
MAGLCNAVSQYLHKTSRSLDGFYLIAVDANGNRALNGFDGDHKRALAIACNQNSFNALQSTPMNADPLSNAEERA